MNRRLAVILSGLLALWAIPIASHGLGVSPATILISGSTPITGSATRGVLYFGDNVLTTTSNFTFDNVGPNVLNASGGFQTAGSFTSSSTGTGLFLSGGVSSSRPCITGYTRVDLSTCSRDSLFYVAWTDAIACTATSPSDVLPTTAKSTDIIIHWRVNSNNALALRGNDIFYYTDAACVNPYTQFSRFYLREQVAVVAGTDLGDVDLDLLNVPLVNESGVMKFRTTETNAAGNGNGDLVNYAIVAYHD